MSRNEIAEKIAAHLNTSGFFARVWTKSDHVRVYISRALSRRTQDMGYVEVLEGALNYNGLTRQRGHVRDLVEACLETDEDRAAARAKVEARIARHEAAIVACDGEDLDAPVRIKVITGRLYPGEYPRREVLEQHRSEVVRLRAQLEALP